MISVFCVISVNVSMSFHEFHIELCPARILHHTQDAQAESAPHVCRILWQKHIVLIAELHFTLILKTGFSH